MTTLELQAAKLELIERLLTLNDDQFVKVKKYVKNLVAKEPVKTYKMPADLLNDLILASEEDIANGRCVGEEEMNDYIDSLR